METCNVKKSIIQFDKISKEDKRVIGRCFLPLVENYFKDEKVQADFKKWQLERQRKSI